MGLSGHRFRRRFIYQLLMLAAHEWPMVEIELQESENFLADGFSLIQIRPKTAVQVFHHGTATVRLFQDGEYGVRVAQTWGKLEKLA